jgi:hypothetical protein
MVVKVPQVKLGWVVFLLSKPFGHEECHLLGYDVVCLL